ncbi:MAG TPA: hypothetical protein VFQ85_18725 [Mycobacteriales bacterium]|jgi:hypothetical protein|nr:hypothetical protein [Mycobacteriales bacterium]
MAPRRRTRVAAAGAALAVALAAGALWYLRLRPAPLSPDGAAAGAGGYVAVGENLYAVVRPFYDGSVRETVRVRAVRVRGVPDGMTIVAVHAVAARPGTVIGAGPEGRGYDFRPVREVVLHPGQGEQWMFVVVAHVTRPGRFVSQGVDVDWSAGIRHGTTRYDLRVLVDTSTSP